MQNIILGMQLPAECKDQEETFRDVLWVHLETDVITARSWFLV